MYHRKGDARQLWRQSSQNYLFWIWKTKNSVLPIVFYIPWIRQMKTKKEIVFYLLTQRHTKKDDKRTFKKYYYDIFKSVTWIVTLKTSHLHVLLFSSHSALFDIWSFYFVIILFLKTSCSFICALCVHLPMSTCSLFSIEMSPLRKIRFFFWISSYIHFYDIELTFSCKDLLRLFPLERIYAEQEKGQEVGMGCGIERIY